MLMIKKTAENGKATLALEGRLDTGTAPEMESAVKEILPGLTELTMDFSKLDYISSAGLRVLLSAQKIMSNQGEMKLTHVSDAIKDIFEVTGFTEILTIV